ncbi:hypothetical protein [Paraliobacillus sediminis]|uniref:hypothetical protein n=1 Tax=Paraliobacillus sediminis TaxID=1885916 RepID=UPI001F07312E|nr:hypothetical protein [Paraliobacillus sediminis]
MRRLKDFTTYPELGGYGLLLSVSIQSKLAAIAVNMKKISAIVSSSYASILIKVYIFRVPWSFG